jgi:hypothetical protein
MTSTQRTVNGRRDRTALIVDKRRPDFELGSCEAPGGGPVALAKQLEQAIQHAVGDSPHDASIDVVCRKLDLHAALALRRERRAPKALKKRVERHPQSFRDLVTARERCIGRRFKDERDDRHADRPAACDSREWRELPQETSGRSQIERQLLIRLADRGRQQAVVTGIFTPAREGHVTGPWIARNFSAPDEETFGAAGGVADDDGHGGPSRVRRARRIGRGARRDPLT